MYIANVTPYNCSSISEHINKLSLDGTKKLLECLQLQDKEFQVQLFSCQSSLIGMEVTLKSSSSHAIVTHPDDSKVMEVLYT